jgi:hypothetical protein
MKDYEDEAFDELEKSLQRKVATGVTDGSKKDVALRLAREALKKCEDALAEELVAWDIDPPLHHVQKSHDLCGPAIKAIDEALEDK